MAKKKSCEWCEQDNFMNIDGNHGHSLSVEIYPENNFIGVSSFAPTGSGEESDEVRFDIPMKYCPNCGRKLV